MEFIYCEETSPILEVSLLSEMAWNNILEETCEREAKIIFKEDSSEALLLMEASDQNLVKKFLNWIREKIKAVTLALKKISDNITAKILLIGNFLRNIDGNNLKDRTTAKVRPWIKSPKYSKIENLTDTCNKIINQIAIQNYDKINDRPDDIYSRLDKFVGTFSNDWIYEMRKNAEELTDCPVDNSLRELYSAKERLKTLDTKLGKKYIDYLKKGESGIEKITGSPNGIMIYKRVVFWMNYMVSLGNTCALALISDHLKVIKSARK